MSKVIVVGGGPAGMFAAIAAAERGHEVVLLEKNEKLGKKLYITGKGRCNITNAGDMDTLFANVMTNPKFLYSAFYDYDNQRVIDFFEENGLATKVERGNRVFPVSDHSSDVIATLQRVPWPPLSGGDAPSAARPSRRPGSLVVVRDGMPVLYAAAGEFPQAERKTQTATVSSLRLDAVLAAMLHCSRGQACEWIAAGRVEINHLPAESAHAPVYEGDVFTVRGKGRFGLTALPGKSKKDRSIIEFFQY